MSTLSPEFRRRTRRAWERARRRHGRAVALHGVLLAGACLVCVFAAGPVAPPWWLALPVCAGAYFGNFLVAHTAAGREDALTRLRRLDLHESERE